MTRFQLRLTHLAVLILFAAFASFLVASVNSARTAARESQCLGNLFFLNHVLHVYVSATGRAPARVEYDNSGRAMHSWRAVVWAYELRSPYDLQQPWDAPANIPPGLSPHNGFACPNTQSNPPRFTNYAAIVDRDGCSLDLTGIVGPGGPWIVLVEVPNSTILWTEPRDVTPAEIARFPAASDPHGYVAAFSDGRCRRLSQGEILEHWSRAKAKLGAAKSPGR